VGKPVCVFRQLLSPRTGKRKMKQDCGQHHQSFPGSSLQLSHVD
jgi:hypothetical protein